MTFPTPTSAHWPEKRLEQLDKVAELIQQASAIDRASHITERLTRIRDLATELDSSDWSSDDPASLIAWLKRQAIGDRLAGEMTEFQIHLSDWLEAIVAELPEPEKEKMAAAAKSQALIQIAGLAFAAGWNARSAK